MKKETTTIWRFRSLLFAAFVFFASWGNGYVTYLQALSNPTEIATTSSEEKNEDNKNDTETRISETVFVSSSVSSVSLQETVSKSSCPIFGLEILSILHFKPQIIALPITLFEHFIILSHHIIAPHAP